MNDIARRKLALAYIEYEYQSAMDRDGIAAYPKALQELDKKADKLYPLDFTPSKELTELVWPLDGERNSDIGGYGE